LKIFKIIKWGKVLTLLIWYEFW